MQEVSLVRYVGGVDTLLRVTEISQVKRIINTIAVAPNTEGIFSDGDCGIGVGVIVGVAVISSDESLSAGGSV
jgi:hypothetical protein